MSESDLLRVAMWSGPRNISTAMMRSWGNRADTVVVDEPLYACYLKTTGKAHPMADEVIANGETDWRQVVRSLTSKRVVARPAGSRPIRIFYQKHMTHHLLPEMERDWLLRLTNCFLIRDPAEVIESYLRKNEAMSFEDLGFGQQAEIFAWVRQHSGKVPPVIDARDVLQNPRHTLSLLCTALEVEFDPAMLSWPPGLRPTDGVWARHWYHEVARSTGFAPYRAKRIRVPPARRKIEALARDCYNRLREFRLA